MGVRIIVEVFDNAPADFTPTELVVLLVLASYANDTTRECSRKRSTRARTWMRSLTPATSGRRQQIPRIKRVIGTPACAAW